MRPDDAANSDRPWPEGPALYGEISIGADAPSGQHEDRVSRRVHVALGAGLGQSGARRVAVQVTDLSTHGFRIDSHLDLQNGAEVWLRLPGLEPRHARVVWVRGFVAGCAFERPLHPAVLDMIAKRASAG